MERSYENDIAIIGIAGRFPDANNIETYWENLKAGTASVKPSDEEKLLASGMPANVLNNKYFVNASAKLEGATHFDADFFGISNTEATLMDPQIRMLLQTSWHAIENAGYAGNHQDIAIGNFCGMSTNSYLISILETKAKNEAVDPLLYRILNEKDFLATWISYKLNLTGPAMSVQTACSTSLLAIHLACQSLLSEECSMALVGGVCYNSDSNLGYMHSPESIYSKDGYCRPFDKDATGTIMGDGVGVIVVKRAVDAIADNDHIYSIIKGTACNNDGANKQSYTTPSVDFQRDVVLEALAVSDVEPDTIGMIEAHGTGTLIGDPIEVAALTEAFREYTEESNYCAIGSVKSNIGHLDAAAGIASIIKATFCVKEGVLVPSINYKNPNPALQLETSPFYVSQTHTPWPDNFEVRRAGISALGVGGTNVHIIIEEPPAKSVTPKSEDRPFVLSLSGHKDESLEIQKNQVVDYLEANSDTSLSDLEFTSLYGRKLMEKRFSCVFENRTDLLAYLKGEEQKNCYEGSGSLGNAVFLFPGQGSQFSNMATDLYQQDIAFKTDMDYCFDFIQKEYGIDFKPLVFSEDNIGLNKTENTQICLFIIEYCLAKSLMRKGVQPQAFVGHSLGEYVAACVVGCISLEDTLRLVFHRGRLMGQMAEGAMVLVRMPEEELEPLLVENVSVCAYNAPGNLVIGGNKKSIRQQVALFDFNNVKYKELRVSHAYHTSMMQDALAEYEQILSKVDFNEYEAKVFSSYTGELVNSDQLGSKEYWLEQIINPVKFSTAISNLANYITNPIFIEVGPGSGLSSFVRTIFNNEASAVNLLPKSSTKNNGVINFYKGVALLCAKGVPFGIPEEQTARRIPLPGYPFTKKHYWKPKVDIQYEDFKTIEESYHFVNPAYESERLRSSLEIHIKDGQKISSDKLDQLNALQEKYLQEVNLIFEDTENKVENIIEMFYEDHSCEVSSDHLGNNSSSNSRSNISSVFVEPETELEKKIATYWEEILGYQSAGVLDNYFEAGGNSLLATQLINKIISNTDVEISIAEVLSNHTIRDIASLIEQKQWLRSNVEMSGELLI